MILVFGKTGQVSSALNGRDGVACLGRDQADLVDAAACAAAIRQATPGAVINAAAYTAVDAAESDEELATQINGEAPRQMAEACAALDIPFVHISTDYVFDGTGSNAWRPDDPTGPVGAYGRSKLAGEAGIRASGARHVILRTSWVFSEIGGNFLKTMLRLGAERDGLRVVDDQIGGPTPAPAIADACLKCATALRDRPATPGGTYHFSGFDDVSWADFAEAIFQVSGLACRVERIPSSDYPTAAQRPLNSRLDCSTLHRDFGIDRPDWQASMAHMIANLMT